MTAPESNRKILVRLHTGLFYFLIVWFLSVSVIFIFEADLARELSYWGIILVIAGTIVRLLTMAAQFFKLRQTRYWLLCGLIVFLIGLTRVLAWIF